MINKNNQLPWVMLDSRLSVTGYGPENNPFIPIITGRDFIDCVFSDYEKNSTGPVLADCCTILPGHQAIITKDNDGYRVCLIEKNFTPDKPYDVINYRMRESISGIFALMPIIVNSINKDDGDKAVLYLENVYGLTYKLLRNVNNISTANRLMSGEGFRTQATDLSSLLESVITSSRTVLRNVTIRYDIQPDIFVCANRQLLSVAILNLISNSIKYRSDEALEINISLYANEKNAVLVYSDNSKGVKGEFRQNIFDPYLSEDPYAEESTDRELGLGLYITRKAFENAGGNILLSTGFGKGVRYTMSMPLVKPESTVLKSNAADFLLNKYSDVYIQLCDHCILPSL